MYSAELIDRLCEVVRAQARIIKEQAFYIENCLYTSYNEQYGLWSKEKNKKLFKIIEKL